MQQNNGHEKKSYTKSIWLILLSMGLLLFSPVTVISEEALVVLKNKQQDQSTVMNWEEQFKQKVEDWIKQISSEDERFRVWHSASWESYPFGPGSRQWIVLITHQEQEVGYLMVGEDHTESLVLIEYGMMDSSTIKDLIDQEKLESHFFYHGLVWATHENSFLTDLITGEHYEHVHLPDVTPFWQGEPVHKLAKVVLSDQMVTEPILHYPPSADQVLYDSTLGEHEHTAKQKEALMQELQLKRDSFFSSQILPGVRGLYSIDSIHTWETIDSFQRTLYIGLKDSGIRFFSLDYLIQLKDATFIEE